MGDMGDMVGAYVERGLVLLVSNTAEHTYKIKFKSSVYCPPNRERISLSPDACLSPVHVREFLPPALLVQQGGVQSTFAGVYVRVPVMVWHGMYACVNVLIHVYERVDWDEEGCT